MCFYDQNVFRCGDYQWDKLQRRCKEHNQDREPCELKLVFRTLVINTKCEICHEIQQWHQSLMIETEQMRRWQREVSEYFNNIQSSRERIRYFEEVIEGLENRRREACFDTTGVHVGVQELPSDVTYSLSSPEACNIISSGASGEDLCQTLPASDRPLNPDLVRPYEDHAWYITERIPIRKPRPAVLLTTPENVLLILGTSDFWNSKPNTKPNTPSDTHRRKALPQIHAGTKSETEPSLVSYARRLSGIRPDIRSLLEGYNVLDRISHMTAEELNGAIDLTEARFQSGLSNLGSINLNIPYHWISLVKISYDLGIDVRRQILKLLSRVLTFSNAIFDSELTMLTTAFNDESSLYEQLLGRIRTRRNFVTKLSDDIETSTTHVSPVEIHEVSHDESLKPMWSKRRQHEYVRKQSSIYPDASFIEISSLLTMASKFNLITFGMLLD